MNNGTVEKNTAQSFARRHSYPLEQTAPAAVKAQPQKRTVKPSRPTADKSASYSRAEHTYSHELHTAPRESVANVAERSIKKLTAGVRDSETINKKFAQAQAWLEIDAKELRVNEKRKKMPLSLMVSIFAICFSLMLIVAGSVVTGVASMELYAAENELAMLREEQVELENKLELKNDLMFIEREARERLGMIDRDFASVEALASSEDEGVTVYENRGGTAAFASLLDALGFVGE